MFYFIVTVAAVCQFSVIKSMMMMMMMMMMIDDYFYSDSVLQALRPTVDGILDAHTAGNDRYRERNGAMSFELSRVKTSNRCCCVSAHSAPSDG